MQHYTFTQIDTHTHTHLQREAGVMTIGKICRADLPKNDDQCRAKAGTMNDGMIDYSCKRSNDCVVSMYKTFYISYFTASKELSN